MNDTTPSEIYQKHAQAEIVIARKFYNSTSQKKRLKANLHFHNALACAQKVLVIVQLGEVADNTVRSNMEAIIAECKKHLPYNIEEVVKKSWSDYINRERNIYRKLFGVFKNTKHETFAEMESRCLECRKKVYEGYAFRYGFLSQDNFVQFFSNPSSIYDNGSLWNSCYAGHVRYTNTVLEFDILFREFLEYLRLKESIESAKAFQFGEAWAYMRRKYMNGKPYVQIDEMIAEGCLDQFSADETVAAIYFCLVYKERFCEGYFLDCCENGIIGKLLLHLRTFG